MKTDLNNSIRFDDAHSQDKDDFISEIKELKAIILNKVSTKTPTAIAKVMLSLFFEKHPETQILFDGIGAAAKKTLLSAGNGDWHGLNMGARDMARIIGANDSQRHYWDMMRYLCYEFPGDPQEREWRQAQRAIDSGKPFEEAYPIKGLTHCAYCWRTVPRRRGKSGTPKCLLHADQQKGAALTQKSRDILSKKMNIPLKKKECILLDSQVQEHLRLFSPHASPPNCIAEEAKSHGYTLKDAWNIAPADLINKFPHVEMYLYAGGIDINSPYDVVRALDMPFDIRKSKRRVRDHLEACRLLDFFYTLYQVPISSLKEKNEEARNFLKQNDLHIADQYDTIRFIENIRTNSCPPNYSSIENKLVQCLDDFYNNYDTKLVPRIKQNSYLLNLFDERSVDVNSIVEVAREFKKICYFEDRNDAANFKKIHYQTAEGWFDECHETIVLAERWLAAETNMKHGGKRAGAGRKPKR